MIIHYNHDKPTNVYVVNSRLPVYKAYYGDGLSNTIAGLFTRIAPKVAPLAKQLSMKTIDVICDKAVGDVAGKAFPAPKNKLMSLVRWQNSKYFQQPVILPYTMVMPANVSKVINNTVEQKLASLASPSLMTMSSADEAQKNASQIW